MSDQQTFLPEMPASRYNSVGASSMVNEVVRVSGVDRGTVVKVLDAIDYCRQPTITFPPSGEKRKKKKAASKKAPAKRPARKKK